MIEGIERKREAEINLSVMWLFFCCCLFCLWFVLSCFPLKVVMIAAK